MGATSLVSSGKVTALRRLSFTSENSLKEVLVACRVPCVSPWPTSFSFRGLLEPEQCTAAPADNSREGVYAGTHVLLSGGTIARVS